MPVDQLRFRTACGSFFGIFLSFMAKRKKKLAAMHVKTVTVRKRITGVLLGLCLVLLFYGDLLYQAGDVEKNPGPKEMRQTRLTSAGRDSPSDKSKEKQATPPRDQPSASDDSMKTVVDMLSTLNGKMDGVQDDITEIKSFYSVLKTELSDMRNELMEMKKENEELKADNHELKNKVEELEKKTDDLENRSKRNNILFHGIPRNEHEKSSDCEAILKDILKDKLKLSSEISFDRIHRLSDKKTSPIVARCTFYKDKMLILKEKRNLKGSNMFIDEDFSRRVQGLRKKLYPHLKKARSEGKRATLVFDHLVIDSMKYTIDSNDHLVKYK